MSKRQSATTLSAPASAAATAPQQGGAATTGETATKSVVKNAPPKPKGWKKWKRRLSRVFKGEKSKSKTKGKATQDGTPGSEVALEDQARALTSINSGVPDPRSLPSFRSGASDYEDDYDDGDYDEEDDDDDGDRDRGEYLSEDSRRARDRRADSGCNEDDDDEPVHEWREEEDADREHPSQPAFAPLPEIETHQCAEPDEFQEDGHVDEHREETEVFTEEQDCGEFEPPYEESSALEEQHECNLHGNYEEEEEGVDEVSQDSELTEESQTYADSSVNYLDGADQCEAIGEEGDDEYESAGDDRPNGDYAVNDDNTFADGDDVSDEVDIEVETEYEEYDSACTAQVSVQPQGNEDEQLVLEAEADAVADAPGYDDGSEDESKLAAATECDRDKADRDPSLHSSVVAELDKRQRDSMRLDHVHCASVQQVPSVAGEREHDRFGDDEEGRVSQIDDGGCSYETSVRTQCEPNVVVSTNCLDPLSVDEASTQQGEAGPSNRADSSASDVACCCQPCDANSHNSPQDKQDKSPEDSADESEDADDDEDDNDDDDDSLSLLSRRRASALTQLLSAVPPEYPLVRELGTRYLASHSVPVAQSQQLKGELEWHLFFTCVEQSKWKLALVLAQKLHRAAVAKIEEPPHKPEDIVLAFLEDCRI